MTATAHVPAREVAAEHQSAQANPFSSLGGRLIALGAAMQKASSTVSELQMLAEACGITLQIRVVEDPHQ